MKRLAFLILALLLLTACTSQEAHLIYLPESTPTAVPLVTPTPKPEPEPIPVAPIQGEGFKTDANGIPIFNEQTHYYEYYLSVNDMRIYEENGETLIDAVIRNNFTQKLTGMLCITFYRDDMKFGYGEFYTAEGGLTLFPGDNRVYADVLTEVDVQNMPFEITVSVPFRPDQP